MQSFALGPAVLVLVISIFPKDFQAVVHTWPVPNRQPTHGHSSLEVRRIYSHKHDQAVSPVSGPVNGLVHCLVY